jgi:hypothetical protein
MLAKINAKLVRGVHWIRLAHRWVLPLVIHRHMKLLLGNLQHKSNALNFLLVHNRRVCDA